jgi:hypothetical protein
MRTIVASFHLCLDLSLRASTRAPKHIVSARTVLLLLFLSTLSFIERFILDFFDTTLYAGLAAGCSFSFCELIVSSRQIHDISDFTLSSSSSSSFLEFILFSAYSRESWSMSIVDSLSVESDKYVITSV